MIEDVECLRPQTETNPLTDTKNLENTEIEINVTRSAKLISGLVRKTGVARKARRGSIQECRIADAWNRDEFHVCGRTTACRRGGCRDHLRYNRSSPVANTEVSSPI